MPRLSNRPPKYSKFGENKARCYINGKQVYLGQYGSPESKAKYNAPFGSVVLTGLEDAFTGLLKRLFFKVGNFDLAST